MAISVVNLSLNAAGMAMNLVGIRNISFYDQAIFESKPKSPFASAANLQAAAGHLLNNGNGRIFNGLPVFSTAVLSAGVDLQGKLCDHPIESGATVSDHKIRMPIRLKCSLVMPAILQQRVVDQLTEYFNTSDKIVIETPTGIYKNMILETLPVNMTTKNVSRPVFDLVFREVAIVFPDYTGTSTVPVNPSDADTQNTGAFTSAINKIQGAASGALDWIGSF